VVGRRPVPGGNTRYNGYRIISPEKVSHDTTRSRLAAQLRHHQ
jgi:hypothetical protein